MLLFAPILQKLAQRDLASMRDLMEICCLWTALREQIKVHIGAGEAYTKVEQMFNDGNLSLFQKNKTGYVFPGIQAEPCIIGPAAQASKNTAF